MARIRSVHPGLASDEAFMTMSMAAKAAWALLWTECDDHGLFEWKPIVLKARIFPADAVDFAAVLAEYETLGCIKQVEIDGKPFGLIRNFGKYQRPKNPSYRYEWRNEFASFAGFPVVLPQPSPSPTEKPSLMKEEGGRREDGKNEEPIGSSYSPAPAKPPRKAKRSAIAEDAEPTDRDREEGLRVGMSAPDLDFQWRKFRDYHRAKGNLMADWSAAWRTWCGNYQSFNAPKVVPFSQGPPRPKPSVTDAILDLLAEERARDCTG